MANSGRTDAVLTRKALAGAPAEFFVVAACCRWPPSEARSAAIRAAARAGVDWPRLVRIVRRHRVWGLVNDGLLRAGIPLPDDIAEAMRARAKGLMRRNLAIATEVLNLQRRFAEAGIGIVFVKGLTLAMLAYGDLSIKHSIDVDMLVAPAHVAAAKLILEAEGYKLIEPHAAPSPSQFELMMAYSKEWAFFARDKNLLIELHWKLSYNPLLLQDIGPDSPLQAVAIGRSELRTLCFEDLFIYLCVHGAQHAWNRLKWLADLAALLAAKGADIETLYRRAEKTGAGRSAGQALLLCARLLGLELPASLARELAGSARVRWLEGLALDAMLGGGAETELHDRAFGTWRVNFSLFFLGEGWRYLSCEFRRYLISSADVMALELPQGLAWLYPILRLPLWIKRRWERPNKGAGE